ncbi:DUF4238 domain-containing protein [Stutzerimonas stutzeri]|uniref:DUF4238 domain-containing protein n=1 Tax=Stutzerimonas stutzeri TaxID=316 RepID=UPI0021094862|nr:DUF4238 domain-containing protein [Stutzerimonas stutzeri]MCQ4258115.1 DUF4238 domain-containing protein [Stutzerimonas stutzeri]
MPSKRLEVKKRHHYVWANYLTRWGNGTNNVSYTTKLGNFAHDSVRGLVIDDYFYTTTFLSRQHIQVIESVIRQSCKGLREEHRAYLAEFLSAQAGEAMYRQSGIQDREIERQLDVLKNNLLENLHASHEKDALPVLAALAKENFDILEKKEHMINFMAFLGQQITRTKTFRDSAIQALSRNSTMEIDRGDAMAQAWWFLSYVFGMNIGFDLYAGRHTAKHALLINDTKLPFITSDQPVVNVHARVSETELIAPEYADFHYPISPRIAYAICDSTRFSQGKNLVDEAIVVEFNTKLAAQAMVHIIGDSVDAIRPYKQFIGQRYRRSRPDVSTS